jgi:biopolymer transport protein ExbB
MKNNLIPILQFLLSIISISEPLSAQVDSGHIINQVFQSAKKELNTSIVELNQVRDQISNEKLPLAEELTSLEDELAKLRQEYEKSSRNIDSGNLDLANLKAEIKARQDELAYIGNILDEYARSFESKIHISEMQYCGKELDIAKLAAENKTLSLAEKFSKQTEFVEISTDRLNEVIGGRHFSGVAVDMQGSVEEGKFAIIGPVTLFKTSNGKTSGLAVSQTGSTNPLIRPLEGEIQMGISSLVEKGEGIFPLDPSRGGALKALMHKTSFVSIFKKGGPIMWPLLIVAVLALLTVLERTIFLLIQNRRGDPKSLEAFFIAVGNGQIDEAITISRKTKFHLVRILAYALEHKEKNFTSALLFSQEFELKRFRRGIPMLDTVITLAPLLGLLGTVTGMMGSFSLIGGELSAPGAITGGIAEALIATAFGLGIAITSLIPFNYLNTKVDEAKTEIEAAATQLELLIHSQSTQVSIA